MTPDPHPPRRPLAPWRRLSSSCCRCSTIWSGSSGTASTRSSSRSTCFLLLPIIAALRGDTTRFLERIAEVQWGLMICVFCLSHVPALLTLTIPGFEGRNLLLIAFLVHRRAGERRAAVRLGQAASAGARSRPRSRPRRPWEGLVGGVASATALGAALWWITPFTPWQAALMALAICADGLLRRAGDVGDQARPRRQGLGPA